jgi:hypothetical protein
VETTLATAAEGIDSHALLLFRGAFATDAGSLLDDLVEVARRHEPTTPLAGDDPTVACLRGLVFGALTPSDRQKLRQGAYASALVASKDEAIGCVAVAIAILTADLCRGFTLDDCLPRCRQTLLEETPMAVLDALHPLAEDAELEGDRGAIGSLQLAITSCTRNRSTMSAIQALPTDAVVARVLAGALSNLEFHDVETGLAQDVTSAAQELAAASSNPT